MNAILAMASLVTAAPRTPSPDPYPRRRRQAAVRRHRWPPQHRGHYRACTRRPITRTGALARSPEPVRRKVDHEFPATDRSLKLA